MPIILKNYNDAIVDYTYCIELEKEFPEALYNRGLVYISQNQLSSGCKDMSKAGEQGVDNAYRVIYKHCQQYTQAK